MQFKKIEYFCKLKNYNFSTQMEQQKNRENTEMNDVINSTEAFIEKNQKKIIIAIIAILVIILAIFGINKLGQIRNEKANVALIGAENSFDNGDFQTALDGNAQFDGLLSVAKKYGNTKSGQRAKYMAGASYLRTGKYNEAISMLKKYKGKDLFTKSEAAMMIGDCELELGNTAKAISYYEKALKQSSNFIVTPVVLFKLGMLYKDTDKEKAAMYFTQIKKNYPESNESQIIEKYLQLTEAE